MTLLLVWCAVSGLCGLSIVRRRVARRRLGRLTSVRLERTDPGGAPLGQGGPGADLRGKAASGSGSPKAERRSRNLRAAIAVASGLGVAGFIGCWWGMPIGVVVTIVVDRFLRRQETPEARAARMRAMTDMPLCADLLAAALRAGAPVDRAAAAVADALGGPLGERLERAARSLRMGAAPPEAWGHLSDVTGADRLVAAAIRSSASGGALAGAFTRLADDLRADRAVVADAAARRAGVLIVLPLGLCFLPAFVLAGLVPVVIAVLGDVL
jgi:Flp pilus assembly protein TadB